MTPDETQIQIFANWPMSHAKRVIRDNRKNPEYRVVAAIRKLRTDTNCPAGKSWSNHVKNEQHIGSKKTYGPQNTENSLPSLLPIYSAHAISHVITRQNIELTTFVLIWCVNIFVVCSVTLTFFRQIASFSNSFQYAKNKKNLFVGSFKYFSCTIHIGKNWYMDTGVRDFEVAFF